MRVLLSDNALLQAALADVRASLAHERASPSGALSAAWQPPTAFRDVRVQGAALAAVRPSLAHKRASPSGAHAAPWRAPAAFRVDARVEGAVLPGVRPPLQAWAILSVIPLSCRMQTMTCGVHCACLKPLSALSYRPLCCQSPSAEHVSCVVGVKP